MQPDRFRARIGSVGSLNAVPLTHGIEAEVWFTTPANLARRLEADALDAALVSITEVLLKDRYDLLDGIAIVSHGPVRSVFLAHRGPLARVRQVYCDTASLASVNLLRVLLAEWGLAAEFIPLPDYETARLLDAVLLIGDRALDFLHGPHVHHIWDLGEAWHDLTGLPFVYAGWALRRGAHDASLRGQLRAAKDHGLANLDAVIRQREDYGFEFRREYLTRNIRFDLGDAEKRGLARFGELLGRHGLGPVFPARFVP